MGYRIHQLEPFVGQEELENLTEVIRTRWLTEGPFSREFLQQLRDVTGARHAILANNGTLALYLALKALGIGPGDDVVVPDFTFNASASSVVFAGARPVFADIDPETLNVDPDSLEQAITPATKALMPVHVYGTAADMDRITQLAATRNLSIIEDAAQGFGVHCNGKHTGTIGDVGTISFFADKTITCGEGAVVMTNRDDLHERLCFLRNQGRIQSGSFVHPELGMNFRMTDLQCAVGVAQIKKFPAVERLKLAHYQRYAEHLGPIEEVRLVRPPPYSTHVPFRAALLADKAADLMEHLEQNGIQTRGFFFPLHRQPCFHYLGYAKEDFPASNAAFERGVCLPVHCALKEDDVRFICDCIKGFYAEGSI